MLVKTNDRAGCSASGPVRVKEMEYPRFGDFLALRDRLDPDRVFDNAYLRRVLGSTCGG